jgi:hypothetical protein
MTRFVWIAALAIGLLMFGSGFVVGRRFPAHYYQRFGDGPLLYDTATGRICTIFKKTNLFDEGLKDKPSKDGLGFPIVQSPSP